MRFAMFCYAAESRPWTQPEDDALMAQHLATQDRVAAAGKLGPSLRLMPTRTAKTVRGGAQPMVIDGPFAETKEALLGFWILEVESLEEALAIAREFASHRGVGSLEVRPIKEYYPASPAR